MTAEGYGPKAYQKGGHYIDNQTSSGRSIAPLRVLRNLWPRHGLNTVSDFLRTGEDAVDLTGEISAEGYGPDDTKISAEGKNR